MFCPTPIEFSNENSILFCPSRQTDCYGVTYSKADLFILVCTPSPMRIRGYVVWADNHKCTARLLHAAIPENSSIQRICIIFVKIQKKKKKMKILV